MSQEEEEKAIEWLKKEITRNKIHIQDCKEAVDVKFYYDLDDEIELTQKDLDAEETLLTIIETQKAEIEKYKKENHNLKEKLQMFIPRRRVRRVYKMIGKILRADMSPELLEKELKKELAEGEKKDG